MSFLMTWRRIPKGSRLVLSVTPPGGQCTTEGVVYTFHSSNPPDVRWKDADIHPGPQELRLKNPRDYGVDIIATFASPAVTRVTVTAQVFKADGSPFGVPRVEELKGKNGDGPDTGTLILVTDDKD